MERLTRRMCGGYGMAYGHELNTVQGMRDAVNRLAAYEDTGLEPEEVAKMLREAISIKKELDEYTRPKREGRLAVLPCALGTEVWVVERDEYGCAVDVSGYMFLAKAVDVVILTAYINDLENVQDTLAYHMNETAENYYTNLAVFPADDCYTTREEAEEALKERGTGGQAHDHSR